jgi:hypothetical protein
VNRARQGTRALIVSLILLPGCAKPQEWTRNGAMGPALSQYATLPHYKALATDGLGGGRWVYRVANPWLAVTYVIRDCERRSKCRIKYLGNSSVEYFDDNQMFAAQFAYYDDDNASFDRLDKIEEVTAANRADGIASVAAMAVVPGQGRRYWALELGDTFKDAERAAVSACTNSKCVVIDYYMTGSCAMAVAGDTQIFWGGEPEQSVDEVMSECEVESKDCEIVKRVCPE